MAKRRKLGRRRHLADATQHDGTVDEHGRPTYHVPGDWDTVVASFPCEVLTTDVGINADGTKWTAYVIYGDYAHGSSITTDMRLTTNDGVEYEIIGVSDADGDRREVKIDAKRELNN